MPQAEKTSENVSIVPEKFLTLDDILAANDRPWESVDVPEWGGQVRVRMLSVAEQEAYFKSMLKIDGDKATLVGEHHQARYLALCICDEKGERMFAEAHVAKLAQKSHVAVKRVFQEAQRINGVRKEDVEAIAKNLQTTISV